MSSEELSPSYWATNLVSTVKFSAALAMCAKSGTENTAYLEVGPHFALQGPVNETLRSVGRDSIDYFYSCLRAHDDLDTMLESAGNMIAVGLGLDTARINAQEVLDGTECKYQLGSLLTDLPGYAWEHGTSFWSESRLSRSLRSRQFPRHPLLGSRYLEDIPSRPSWRNLLMPRELPWYFESKGVEDVATRGKTIPASFFILMALEAASQLQTTFDEEASSLFLSDVSFIEDMPLSLFTSLDTIIELHLNARSIGEGSAFEFDITSFPTDESSPPTCHCKGKFGWNKDPCKASKITDFAVEHDPFLLERMYLLNSIDMGYFGGLKVSYKGSTGTFESSEELPDFKLHPLVLESVLRMPSISALGSTLPLISKLSSIGLATFPTALDDVNSGLFAVKCDYLNTGGFKSEIELLARECYLSFCDVCFMAVPCDLSKPAPRSLFFKEVEVPDVANSAFGQMDLATCLNLITYKWPVSDIGVVGLSRRDASMISSLLRDQESLRFRSLQIVGDATEPSDDFIRFASGLDMSSLFHAIFLEGDSTAADLHGRLHRKGLVCCRASGSQDWKDESDLFEKLCDVTGLSGDGWVLYRKKATIPPSVKTNRPITIFMHPDRSISSWELQGCNDNIPLQVEEIRGFCRRSTKGPYDAVVVDSAESSVISTWAGPDLIPWLQDLLAFSKRIVWVTQKNSHNPFLELAGNLLHTLQSEQPSLEVMWLIFHITEDQSVVRRAIESACSGTFGEDHEIQHEWRSSQIFIKRYLPDHELSAFTGASVPQITRSPVEDKDYEVAVSSLHEPTVLVSNPSPTQDKGNATDIVVVKLEASVVAAQDVIAFDDPTRASYRHSGLRFFSGNMVSEPTDRFNSGAFVTGWHSTALRRRIEVPQNHLLHSEESESYQCQAARLAILYTSLAIVDGFARARLGDTFKIKVHGDLREEIARLVKMSGAIVLDEDDADFTIYSNKEQGIMINGSPLDLERYLESEHGIAMANRLWKMSMSKVSTRVYDLSSLKAAYGSYDPNEPCSSVIVHTNIEQAKNKLAVYKNPERLFSDGAYIIIGGLGGLGCFVCSWMVSHGAKHLISISRSGISSKEAQETFNAINSTEATLEVLKADARNKQAISTAFSQIRQHHKIKGVINLAMLLGDAPLANMTGEEWDRALRLKIDSSWSLHEETLQDDLELFILFSSIASVLGNRNQAGYNVGNTFLNALATYRRSLNLPGISIALGAMSESISFSYLSTLPH